MKERWKDIEGYKGYYQVSNKGRIFSVRTNKFKTTGRFEWRIR